MKHYEQPELKIEEFEVEDIITTSGGTGDLGDDETDFVPNN